MEAAGAATAGPRPGTADAPPGPMPAERTIEIEEVTGADVEPLVPFLLLAEPSERALRWSLRNLCDAVYRLDVDGVAAGAATVRWAGEPSEIVELGVDPARHGQGLGRHFVRWLVDEARRRGHRALEVGTANASIGNIAFYQKCGFRMAHVRRDYFSYYATPRIEDGIEVRDLLVFRHDLGADRPAARPARR